MVRAVLIAAVMIAAAQAARADDVVLKNGSRIEGATSVTMTGNKVRVKLAQGELTFAKNEVAKIVKKPVAPKRAVKTAAPSLAACTQACAYQPPMRKLVQTGRDRVGRPVYAQVTIGGVGSPEHEKCIQSCRAQGR